MAGESILLIWALAAFAFALGWAVRHWLHRAERRDDGIDAERQQERGPDRLEVVLHQHEIDLREEREKSRENDR